MHKFHHRIWGLAAVLLISTGDAWAQDDDLSDIFGGEPTQTAGQERRALESEADMTEEVVYQRDPAVIKTLQRKTFVKIDRYEVSGGAGFVTNDPFLNRYLGRVGGVYHITEILGVEGAFMFSPELGDADKKPITKQLYDFNKVSPDISKIQFAMDMGFQFSPIYGKVAVSGKNIVNFDLFGQFGTGVVRTADDLEAIGEERNPSAIATQGQLHPTLTYGGGVRIIMSQGFATRVEARGLSYIEVLEGHTLEMKNNMALLVSASWIVPGME